MSGRSAGSARSARSAGSTRPVTLVVGALTALVLAGAACGSGRDNGGGAVTMVSGDYRSSTASTFPLVDGTDVQLTLTAAEVSLSAGCNTLAASYSLAGDVLVVDDVAATLIGCPPDLADQDARLAAFLTARPVVSSSADGMTWTGGGGTTLVFVDRAPAESNRPLQGTR